MSNLENEFCDWRLARWVVQAVWNIVNPFTAQASKLSRRERAHIHPCNSIYGGPVTHFLSMLCILVEVLSAAHSKGEKSLNDFKFDTFIGRFPSDDAARMTVKGLSITAAPDAYWVLIGVFPQVVCTHLSSTRPRYTKGQRWQLTSCTSSPATSSLAKLVLKIDIKSLRHFEVKSLIWACISISFSISWTEHVLGMLVPSRQQIILVRDWKKWLHVHRYKGLIVGYI